MATSAEKRQPATPRTRVRRLPELGAYDRGTIHAVLDAALVCHLAFVADGQPYSVPTLCARVGDEVYVHGSSASRTLRTLGAGGPACLTATVLDGLVLARSVFEHSVNYRSAMLLGTLRDVEDPERKLAALEAFTEKLLPGRWQESRLPTRQELRATSILAMRIDEASAKVRTGPPDDGDSPDAKLPIWAGEVPLRTCWGAPVPDPVLPSGVPVPESVRRLVGERASCSPRSSEA